MKAGRVILAAIPPVVAIALGFGILTWLFPNQGLVGPVLLVILAVGMITIGLAGLTVLLQAVWKERA